MHLWWGSFLWNVGKLENIETAIDMIMHIVSLNYFLKTLSKKYEPVAS